MAKQRALVTGVSSGIGAATARMFADRGVSVIGVDRNEPSIELEAFYQLDLGDFDAIDRTVQHMKGEFDYVCNIAGVPPTLDKQTVLRVNFFGLRHFTEALAGKLAQGASIVSVASLAGIGWRNNLDTIRSGLATSAADANAWIAAHCGEGAQSYHLSKELLIAWTVSNWDKWRERGIRINTVSPGPVATPILSDFIETLGKRAEDDLKINRAGTPDEIAPVILFLCSAEARWINGADIAADGGAGASAHREMSGLARHA